MRKKLKLNLRNNITTGVVIMESETDDFRGLRYNPTLESEVVMLFSLLIPHLPDSYAIEEGDHHTFPDCLAWRNGQKVGIEFEVYSNNFFEHKHDKNDNLTKCNIIVCWKNNIPNTIKRDGNELIKLKGHEIEIISLYKKAKSHEFIKDGQRPDIYRLSEERFFEQLENTKPKNYNFIKKLYDHIRQSEDFELKWGGGGTWSTMKFYLKKWGITPISVREDGYVEIVYQGNPAISPYEIPKETQKELQQIFKRYKHKWHKIPFKTETDLNNIKKALKILSEHSKLFDIIWHTKN